MGTTGSLLLVGAGAELIDRGVDEVVRLEGLWSRFRSDSDLMRLASAAGRSLRVDASTATLIAAMRDGWHITDGDFDPSILPALLGIGYDRSLVDGTLAPSLPVDARSRADLDLIRIDGEGITLPRGMALDPGGIGKGLAADLVADLLMSAGARGALVEIGGDVRARGEAPDGTAWRIRIADPFDDARDAAVVRLAEGAVATSSQRRRRFTGPDDIERHHLIDPRTGMSARSSVQTATVIASTTAAAEVLTKPAFVREPRAYLDWLEGLGAQGMVVDDSGATTTTAGWKDFS